MPSLLVGYGWRKAVSLFGMDVNHSWLIGILHALEHFDELFDIVSFFQILIFKAPCLKPVVLACAVALAKGTKVLIYAAMVFGYRHFVVVYHDDDASTEF